jgi:hypothetical protein
MQLKRRESPSLSCGGFFYGLIHLKDRGFELQLVPPDILSKALKRRKRKMCTQKYQDLTYLFGPPSGVRYDTLAEQALASSQSFSDIYCSYIRDLFTNFEEEFFDRVFSEILGKNLQVNRTYSTYQLWIKRSERYEKFYLSPDDESAKVPALMFFPPEFTNVDGSQLNEIIEPQHLDAIGCLLGLALKLDWVQVHGVLAKEFGV